MFGYVTTSTLYMTLNEQIKDKNISAHMKIKDQALFKHWR